MKKIIIYSFLVFLTNSVNATVLQVDNNAVNPGVYTNLQTAINTAVAGDTIMVKGYYNDFEINKPLTVIGTGYNGEVTFVDGRITISSSSVLLTGFRVSFANRTIWIQSNPSAPLHNVIVERCYCTGPIEIRAFGGAHSGIVFRNNIIGRGPGGYGDLAIAGNLSSITFENNIIDNFNLGTNPAIGNDTFIVRNNLFVNGSSLNGNSDAIVSNNIFYGCNPQGCSSCTFFNNLTYLSTSNDTLPGNNATNIIGNPLMIDYSGGGFSLSNDYNLSGGSPCIGTGTGGTSIGISGGYFPFKVGDGPKIPVVEFLNISNSAVQQGSQFFLQFDARVTK